MLGTRERSAEPELFNNHLKDGGWIALRLDMYSRRLFRAFSYIAILFLLSFAWGQSAPVVTTDSVSPENGSGGSQLFTFVFSDSNGYQDLLNRFPHVIFGGVRPVPETAVAIAGWASIRRELFWRRTISAWLGNL
ncbi:MAG TPA: hypothetical protein VN519_10730 [Bryobacteraceae bacterium]|nr:hypothetical protein [Bryobacteraceae bacterium]